MKKYILALFTLISPVLPITAHQIVEKKVIFLWDLHHVVLKPHKSFRTAMSYPHKTRALFGHKSGGKVIKLLFKGMFKEPSSDSFIHLAEKYNNPHLKEMVLLASNAQKPMQDTVTIIQELAQNGYTHHIGSNIGNSSFIAISDPKQFPEFSPIFKNFDLAQSHVVAHTNGHVIKKPDPKFFEQYLAKNKIDLKTTTVIFIDDKKENIQAAQKLGFTGVQFKNATQLRSDLSALGIHIKKA